MSASLQHATLVPFAAHGEGDKRIAGRIQAVLSWPKRWWDNMHAHDLRAELGEREWHDFGAGPRDFGAGDKFRESLEERAARRRAVSAWFGHVRPQIH